MNISYWILSFFLITIHLATSLYDIYIFMFFSDFFLVTTCETNKRTFSLFIVWESYKNIRDWPNYLITQSDFSYYLVCWPILLRIVHVIIIVWRFFFSCCNWIDPTIDQNQRTALFVLSYFIPLGIFIFFVNLVMSSFGQLTVYCCQVVT